MLLLNYAFRFKYYLQGKTVKKINIYYIRSKEMFENDIKMYLLKIQHFSNGPLRQCFNKQKMLLRWLHFECELKY